MPHSIFDIFKIGIGPSSSHTVGPMIAAGRFVTELESIGQFNQTATVTVDLYGSLALTGKGHGTDRALLAGLEGERPETADPRELLTRVHRIAAEQRLRLLGKREIPFDPAAGLNFRVTERMRRHSNGLHFKAYDENRTLLLDRVYYSIGGGFVIAADESDRTPSAAPAVSYPFATSAALLDWGRRLKKPIVAIVLENEKAWRPESEVHQRIQEIWQVMQQAMERGWETSGILPGGLTVERRAPRLYQALWQQTAGDALSALDWVNAAAIAVTEENAAGGRIVTAPTNGAAGVLPAVLLYYVKFCPGADEEGIFRFFLTAGAIGLLYKEQASISGAEVGCQGEVGVACSMAAAGLAAALKASNEQVENAAEIGMEHNLGMTCDPVAGLVQIPCIERNAMGAVKSINASRMALQGSGLHKVTLDQVIETMRQTGQDMKSKYKETSQGGLAVNAISC
jgi:L-serine dehydratase